jgi:hypothetical protein
VHQQVAKPVNLERWTLAAEVLSALAVLATLIVLIFEVREGNRVARVAAFQEITWEFNDNRRDLLRDPESLELLLSAFRSGEYPDWGSPEEKKLNTHLLNTFNTWNVAFLSYQSGIVGESEWLRLERGLCAFVGTLPDEYRHEQYAQMTDDFIAHIGANC